MTKHDGEQPLDEVFPPVLDPNDARAWLNGIAAEQRPLLDREHAERYVQTRAVIEFADVRVLSAEKRGGKDMVVMREADWNRVVAVARGHVSDAAREVIERVIAGDLATPPPAPEPGADAAWATLGYELALKVGRSITGVNAVIAEHRPSIEAALARPTPALDVEGLINDLYDAIFAIPIREVDPDTGKVTPADPEEVRDAALGAVILARLAARATEGGTDR